MQFVVDNRQPPLQIFQVDISRRVQHHVHSRKRFTYILQHRRQFRLTLLAALRRLCDLLSFFLHVRAQFLSRKNFRRGSVASRRRSRGCFVALFRRLQHRVRTVREVLQRFSRSPTRTLVTLKRPVDPLQRGLQRHSRLLPRFHNCPIQRRHQQVRATLLPKIFLDLREIVEVVPVFHKSAVLLCARSNASASVALFSFRAFLRARQPRCVAPCVPRDADSFPKSIASPSASKIHRYAVSVSTPLPPAALVLQLPPPLRRSSAPP